MIKVEVLEDFTLKDFGELKNIERGTAKEEKGKLFKYDKFECSKDMCEYLTGKNPLNRPVVKVIEVVPEKIKKEFVKPLEEAPIEDALSEEATRAYLDDKPIKPKKKKTSKK